MGGGRELRKKKKILKIKPKIIFSKIPQKNNGKKKFFGVFWKKTPLKFFETLNHFFLPQIRKKKKNFPFAL